MKALGLAIVSTLIAASCAQEPAPPLATCPADLRPLPPFPVPKLPIGGGVGFSGAARVRFVVDRNGHVHSPIIVSDAGQPIEQKRDGLRGYREAIIATAAQLRYPAQREPCRLELPFEMGFGGDEAPSADAANP